MKFIMTWILPLFFYYVAVTLIDKGFLVSTGILLLIIAGNTTQKFGEEL